MLYKPKNIYPKINTDKPAIYLNKPDEIINGVKHYNISFNANGTEKIKTVDCLLSSDGTVSLPYTTNYNDLQNFKYVTTKDLYLGRYQGAPQSFDIMCEGKIDYKNGKYSCVRKQPIYLLDEHDAGGYNWCHSSDNNFQFCNILLSGRIARGSYCDEIIDSQYKILNIFSSQPEDIKWIPPESWKVYCSDARMRGTGNMLYGMMLNQTSLIDETINNLIIRKTDIVLNKSICQMSFDTENIKIKQLLEQYGYQSTPYPIFNDIIPTYIKTKHICSITKITDLDDGKIQLDCKCTQSVIDEQLSDTGITNICVHRLNNIIITLEPMPSNSDQYKVISWQIPQKQGLTCSFLVDANGEVNYASYKHTWDGIEISKLTVDFSIISTSSDNLIGAQTFDDFPSEDVYYTYKIAERYLSSFQGMLTYQLILNDSVYSDKINVLVASNKPEISISINEFSITSFNFIGTFTSSELKETIVSYIWKLYDATNQLIYKTNKKYSQDFQFEYDNLIPGDYVVEASVEDNYGQIWSKRESFSVNYEQNDLYLNLQSELDKENTGVKLKWDKPEYGEINFGLPGINDNNFSIENGILVENGPGEKDISSLLSYAMVTGINLLEPLKNYISIKGSFNKWLPFNNNTIGEQTYDEVYSLGFLDGIIIYLCVKNNINYLILQDIYSVITLDPIEIEQNLEKEDFLQGIEINIKNKNILIQYNDKFTDIDASNFSYFFEKVSGQYQISLSLENISTLDYIVASNDSMFDKDTNTWKNDDNLKWNPDNYSCLLTFLGDKPYSYLDPNANVQITGYKLKRYNPLTQKVLNIGQYYFTQPEEKLEFYFDNITLNTSNCIVGKIYSHPITEYLYLWNGSNLIPYTERRFVDYSLPHNEEVKYLIYPQGNKTTTNEESQELISSPIYSDSIKGDWDKWCLFTTRGPAPKNLDGTTDNGYNENVLLVDKIFFFEMNVETGSMKNNTDFSVIKNFTPYPHIQRSPSNYWSGQLKGLLGRLAIDDCTFKQTPTMLQEIKELTQNTSRKFLKDRDGNFWEVELSSDITIDNNDKLDVQLKTKSFNWVEVGDASGIALVSVGPGREEWLLTELGQEQIDISKYIWDDNAVWDDSDFWTESE